ncbi:MAG: hypothetical protein D6731_22505 [Planctomycetota bacterium]|nr:MAG: hypothetical protein D6731_22505 [Planctomycetota bacterium]
MSVAGATLADVTPLLRSLVDSLERKATSPTRAVDPATEAVEVFARLKRAEADHVAAAVGAPEASASAFADAQAELARLRRAFAARLRALLPACPAPRRRALLTMAVLAEEAPLTTWEDVLAMREGRRRRSA